MCMYMCMYMYLHMHVQDWAEKPDLTMTAIQLMALIVSHAPAMFWSAHMDVSKEAYTWTYTYTSTCAYT